MTAYKEIITEISDHILTITLNRPEKLNAISSPLAAQFQNPQIQFRFVETWLKFEHFAKMRARLLVFFQGGFGQSQIEKG